MRKFRNIPALITLLAGFIVAVFMIMEKFTLINFLWILICSMFGFYIVGIILRIILNKVFKDEDKNTDENEDNGENGENEDSEEVEKNAESEQ